MSEEATATTEEKSTELVEFSPIRKQVKEMKEQNAKLTFDLNNKAQLESAKGHVKHLKTIRKKVETTHKTVKADALAFGRKVDAVKNELFKDMNEMIDLHEEPIKQLKIDEDARVARHIANVQKLQLPQVLPNGSEELKKLKADLEATVIDESWQEYSQSAEIAIKLALDVLQPKINFAESIEAKDRELEELKKKNAERDEEDRKVKVELEEKEAERKRKEMEEERAKLDAEQEEQRKKQQAEEIEQAKKDEAERIENERKAKEEEDRKAEEARKAGEEHRQAILDRMASEISSIADIGTASGIAVAQALIDGKIPHTTVQF